MSRDERRRRTRLKLLQREHLMEKLGLQSGLIYKRHREKIQHSSGYMRTGNVSHYASVRPTRKTRSRDRYGSIYQPPKRDVVKINILDDQVVTADEPVIRKEP